MKQLREFAQRKPDFDKANTELVGISVDDVPHSRKVWDQAAHNKVTILSDPGAQVIRKYGLLHEHGRGDEDIALRATIVLDENGREIYRKVSSNVADLRTPDEVLAVVK